MTALSKPREAEVKAAARSTEEVRRVRRGRSNDDGSARLTRGLGQTASATVVADMDPRRPPDSEEFFRQLEAIVSAPEWRRSRLRDFLKHAAIFAFGLLVISFALALLAAAVLLLAPTLQLVTDGFETADLKAAKMLLDEIG
jgi:hypothetical protein